jgi:acetyl-CoA acetyltransferase
MTDAFVLGGVRTPVGRYGGSLSHIRTDDLLGQTMVWACERVGVPLDRIEDIAAGCVNPRTRAWATSRAGRAGRGLPDSVPAATVNRFCASSLTCAIQIAHAIRATSSASAWRRGRVDVALGLGVHEGRGAVHAARPDLHARHDVGGRGRAAEPGAPGAQRLHRDDADRPERRRPVRAVARGDRRVRAALAHQAAAARDNGRLAKEIHPVEIPATRRQPAQVFEHDESIRDDTTAEKLAALPAQPNTTQMTAGNSSPLNDGASAVVLAGGRGGRRSSAPSHWRA